MARSTCDGDAYIHNLAVFIRTHERQLANALVAYKKLSRKQRHPQQEKDPSATTTTAVSQLSDNIQEISYDDSLTPEMAKPVRLSLSLHHLYFILERFQELGINIGPMDIRLDTMDSENSNNYVSFLSEFSHSKKIQSDSQSIHSMSSVKSVMSSVSALWNTLGLASTKSENITTDLKYLNSAFTKLPCLRLANEPNAKLIEGHEEYPFETATPVKIFKSIVILEICDLDPKEIYGWDFLSEKLRHLTIKSSTLIDPVEVLVELVKSDLNIRGASTVIINDDDNLNSNNNNNNNNNNNDNSDTNNNIASNTNSNHNKSESSSPGETYASLELPPSSSTTITSGTSNGKKSPSLTSQPAYPHYHHHNYQVGYHHNYQPGTHYQTGIHHNYQSGYHHKSHNNHSLGYDSTGSQSLISSSPSTYHSRSSPFNNSGIDEIPILTSTRRSHYYYKPKGRRSRGSNNINSDWNDEEYESHHHINSNNNNLDSLSGSRNLNTMVGSPPVSSYDTLTNISAGGGVMGPPIGNTVIPIDSLSSSLPSVSAAATAAYKPQELIESWKPLKKLSFVDTKIERISNNAFDQLGGLLSLDLSNNNMIQIPEIPLSKLVNLRNLNLSYNKLFSTRTFPKGLNKLTSVNLRGNKINDLNSLENLISLENIDLRNNMISNIKDLKPLFIINKKSSKVLIKNLLLIGNPISNYRGNRIEIFNLFNGVDINNLLKIDGSRPGMIEARMLLDEKTAKMKFKNFIDESIISKMTASVSNMNLNSFVKMTTTTTSNGNTRQSFTLPISSTMVDMKSSTRVEEANRNNTNTTSTTFNKNNNQIEDSLRGSTPIKPHFSFNSGSITPDSKETSLNNSTPTSTSTITTRGVTVSGNGILPPQFTNHGLSSNDDLRTLASTNNVNVNSTTNSNVLSRRTSQETTHTVGGNTNGTNGNFIRGISLGTPALPIITQAITTTIVGANNGGEVAETTSLSKRRSSLPSTKSSRSIHGMLEKPSGSEGDDNSGGNFSSGLKISVT